MKTHRWALMVMFLVLGLAQPAYGAQLTIGELLKNPQQWNNQQVEITGEALGDLMRRDEHVWLNLGDQGAALGVWGEAALFEDVVNLGDYNHSGDIVRVKGEFHFACPEHGGDMDLHVQELEVIEAGAVIEHPFDEKRAVWAVIFLLTSVFLGIPLYQRRRRQG